MLDTIIKKEYALASKQASKQANLIPRFFKGAECTLFCMQ